MTRENDSTSAKFRFVWLDDDGDWIGTNDRNLATEQEDLVLDCVAGKSLDDGSSIIEATPDVEEEEEDEEE